MECQHYKNGRCMQDPKYHKPDEIEIAMFCGTENYCYCPIFEKYSGLEGMSCG
ncbi:MAG: hypothetical protein ACNA7I_02870 [Candidatus Methanoperedens sp.]|nr:hypothetical protein [Candidatus Methanoperedens sp.]